MPAAKRAAHADLIPCIDRSDIGDGGVSDLEGGIREVVADIEEAEPQLIQYGFYVDSQAGLMTVTAIHRDSASLEFHLEVGNEAFRRLGEMIVLKEIEVYGSISSRSEQMLEQKLRMLGGDSLTVHERFTRGSRDSPVSRRPPRAQAAAGHRTTHQRRTGQRSAPRAGRVRVRGGVLARDGVAGCRSAG